MHSRHEARFLPPVIRWAVEDLRRASGIEPHVAQLGISWRVWVRTERVYVSVTWKLTGVCQWANTKRVLRIDDETRFLTADNDRLARLFRDPDGKLEPDTLPPLPVTETAAEEVPGVIQQVYDTIRRKQGEDAKVLLAKVGDQWVIGLEEEVVTLHINFRANRRGAWRLDPKDPLRLIIEGYDYTEELDGNLSAALALMMGAKSAPSMPPALGSPTPAARSNAVETRRATVFRI